MSSSVSLEMRQVTPSSFAFSSRKTTGQEACLDARQATASKSDEASKERSVMSCEVLTIVDLFNRQISGSELVTCGFWHSDPAVIVH